jgi:hypothetical protein
MYYRGLTSLSHIKFLTKKEKRFTFRTLESHPLVFLIYPFCHLGCECVNSKNWGKKSLHFRMQTANRVRILECEPYKNKIKICPLLSSSINNFEWNTICKLKCESFIHLIFYFSSNLSTLVALIHVYCKYSLRP